MVRRIGVPVVRYPGGNFVSGFNWEDSVGPRDKRPKRLDLAWSTTETTKLDCMNFTMVAVSQFVGHVFGEPWYRGPDEARQVVEYCNHPGGTIIPTCAGKMAGRSLSILNCGAWVTKWMAPGRWATKPLGNMVVSPEAGKMMKLIDPSIELVACGSASSDMPTFGDWELQVLDECYDTVDYLSLHRYYGNPTNDTPGLFGPVHGFK